MTLHDGTSCWGVRRNLLLAIAGVAAAVAFPAVARGHEAPTAALRVEVAGAEARVACTLPLRDLAGIVDVDPDGDGLLARDEYAASVLPALYRHVAPRLALASGSELPPSLAGPVFPGRAVSLGDEGAPLGLVVAFRAAGPIEALRLRCDPLTLAGEDRRVATFDDGTTAVLEGATREVTWAGPPAPLERLVAFVGSGAYHILIGWDHLAFLLALLIAARDLRAVAALVTAFTCAHSVTLGLTVLGVVAVPAQLVEPTIALSIAVAAWSTLRGGAGHAAGKRAWALAFAFGLVHGLGFGGCVLDLELERPAQALLGFNLGVELGQLAVVAAAWPVLALIRRRERLHRLVVVQGGSSALLVLGLAVCLARVVEG